MPDRTVAVKLTGDISQFNRSMLQAAAGAKAFSKELDSGTDRATNLTQSILAVGPALVPISAAAVPAIAGLTNQMAFAAAGAGVAALAFSGVGDALKALNDYQIEPTEANFAKLQETMHKLGPAGQEFVSFLQGLRPELQELQSAAQEGLFPGAEAGIRDLMTLLPQVESIVSGVAQGLGQLIAEAGENLADPRWAEFFTFLEDEAKPTLITTGRTLGNLAEGFANLWMAFDPLSDQFSESFLEMARDFAKWTDGLDKTEGFQEFLAYVERVGPKVWDALGAIADAFLQIVEAAAPVGEATLPIITALAKAIGTVADSDLGPVIIGVVSLTAALSRLKAIGVAANSSAIGGLFGKTAFSGGLANIKAASQAADELRAARAKLADNPGMQGLTVYRENLKGVSAAERSLAAATKERNAQFRAAGVGVATMAFAMSDLDNKLGLTNTAMGAMVGSAFGPWGAALGGGIGLVKDFASANGDAAEQIKELGNQVAQAGIKNLDAQRDAAAKADALAEIGGGDPKLFEQADKVYDAYQKNVHAAQDAKFAEAGLSAAMSDTSQATRDQTEALIDNIAKHNERANALLGDRGAMRNMEAAIDAATAAAKQNGKTLDINTDKGRNNQAALDAIAASYNGLSDKAKANTATQDRVRNAIIRAAVAMGKSSTAAKKLADDLLEIPSVNPKVRVDISDAFTQIANLKRYLKGIKDEEVRVHIRESIESGGGRGHQTASADGNIIDYYANGGIRRENHIAMIAPAGSTQRVWNEPETKGEAYIPLAPEKRERSLDIWAETGRRLGVVGFDNGGFYKPVADGGASSAPSLAPAATISIPTIDYDRLADAVAARKIVLGSREFALAVQDANNYAGRH